ncbi:hypothetical protein QBC47DRAFT_299711 [Echria macrotheca]|uniref:Zn(2)-C6 fungal-type domain-containing protein n=1 Tax=Echria macrotheca TaxID=438768 RepID=A0AAJ0BFN0_9PEZI|nr:hypothetical protein QBC47DRAFT_299711 [Echria macrotheca]
MTRKGSNKVKTGCFTCKKRKVKCDETKPQCLRCTRTGRKCDGYSPPAPGSYSWSELLGRQPVGKALTVRRNTKDGRALEFFHQVVAPAFSRFPGDDFWTRMVAQASLQEPAVRHAVLAISSMYEMVDGDERDVNILAKRDGRFALAQYSQALQQLAHTQNESIVLFVCILFICIEALQGNNEAALTHCRYGMQVFNNTFAQGSSWTCDYFRPIFVRLTACPFFFGASSTSIPMPMGSETEDMSSPPTSYDVCRYRADLLVSRCIRFVREFERFESEFQKDEDVSEYTHFHELQSQLIRDVRRWQLHYEEFEAAHPPPPGTPGPFLLLKMIGITCFIWVSTCAPANEMIFDEYLDDFQKIADMAGEIAEAEKRADEEEKSSARAKPKFVLEMAFIPVLFFVVVKCRRLATRIAALEHMKTISPGRENLWQRSIMYSMGRRIIEMEHGIDLDDADQVAQSLDVVLPNSRRLRNAVQMTPDMETGQNTKGIPVACLSDHVPPSQKRMGKMPVRPDQAERVREVAVVVSSSSSRPVDTSPADDTRPVENTPPVLRDSSGRPVGAFTGRSCKGGPSDCVYKLHMRV